MKRGRTKFVKDIRSRELKTVAENKWGDDKRRYKKKSRAPDVKTLICAYFTYLTLENKKGKTSK